MAARLPWKAGENLITARRHLDNARDWIENDASYRSPANLARIVRAIAAIDVILIHEGGKRE